MNQASPATSNTRSGYMPATCARCGGAFGCGVNAAMPCWCAALPTLARIDPVAATCLCPACLAQALAAQSSP